jgi:hypothetical protein
MSLYGTEWRERGYGLGRKVEEWDRPFLLVGHVYLLILSNQ